MSDCQICSVVRVAHYRVRTSYGLRNICETCAEKYGLSSPTYVPMRREKYFLEDEWGIPYAAYTVWVADSKSL